MADTAISVDKVEKVFRLPHERHFTLKQAILNWHRKSYESFVALKDVSFEIKQGEFFSVVGRNGSGKSTLLKIMAGIYVPTTGGVKVYGQLTPFIELGVGFNMELSGRDNVFLNGTILGLAHKQIEKKYEDIVAFAELGQFMDQKLKNYSSGMQVRLAFSIAIQAQTDILLVDEVLAVGDVAFQQKCFGVFEDIKQQGKTVVFVSHDLPTIERLSDRVLVLEHGRNHGIFDPKTAAAEYAKLNKSATQAKRDSDGES